MEKPHQHQAEYLAAKRKVKKIRGFYVHETVYFCVTIFLVLRATFANIDSHQLYNTVELMLFWGIGVAVHGISVFMPNIFLGKEWEERKIKELMENENF